MKRLAIILLALALSDCVSAPYTGRRQLMLVGEADEIATGQQAYRQVMRESVTTDDPRAFPIVRRVGERIADAANKPEYKWEFRVINDPDMVNAFCVPGGKVAVYTGIFPAAHDEAGLAVVLGHEVAHALLRHSGERMSQAEVLGAGMMLAGASGVNPGILQALGLGASVGVILPFSRSQESEADQVGLLLMAKAGYDPRAALEVWDRMARLEKSTPPAFLSTHPSNETRIQDLRAMLPEALKYYQGPANERGELLPAPQLLDTAAARAERELLKRIQTINSYVEQQSGERPVVAALSSELRLSPQVIVQERQQLRMAYGQYTALRGLSYIGRSPINRIVADYQRGRPWTEIAQANGSGIGELNTWLGGVIRTTNEKVRQLRTQPYYRYR
ncbi:MAG TPA: M48 family metallopeptidase [Candidatus Binatia bacterium]|jgi:predicted Zn-dependent protease